MVNASTVKQCERCGKDFTPRTYWQRFCSGECRWATWDEQHPRGTKQEAS